jgi:hypothetical protein
MASALDQAKGSAPSFGGPLDGLHNLIDQLPRYQGPIYSGGGGKAISNQGGRRNLFEISRSFGYFCGGVVPTCG